MTKQIRKGFYMLAIIFAIVTFFSSCEKDRDQTALADASSQSETQTSPQTTQPPDSAQSPLSTTSDSRQTEETTFPSESLSQTSSSAAERASSKSQEETLPASSETSSANSLPSTIPSSAGSKTNAKTDDARVTASSQTQTSSSTAASSQSGSSASKTSKAEASTSAATKSAQRTPISWNSGWLYAKNSAIHSGQAVKYRSTAANRKNITVCVNAGHGTKGGANAKTLCHPDGSPKVTGGSTAAGATKSTAVAGGMTFLDGSPESQVTLAMAKILKEKLLANGYDVVMIRESGDVQLDNVARTVIANNNADCHVSLHWDSTSSNKGAFFMSVPNNAAYRAMEPVASRWKQHNALGNALISGLKSNGVKIFSGGSMEIDLTQTSYSTIPSASVELGDKASDHSAKTLNVLANGLLSGINNYFGK